MDERDSTSAGKPCHHQPQRKPYRAIDALSVRWLPTPHLRSDAFSGHPVQPGEAWQPEARPAVGPASGAGGPAADAEGVHVHNGVQVVSKGKGEGLERRLERLAAAKAWGLKVGRSAPRDEFHRGCNVSRCGTWVLFKRELREDARAYLAASNFCNEYKLCPFCAIWRSARIVRTYAPKLQHLVRERRLAPISATFTVPNAEDFDDAWALLRDSIKRFLKRCKNAKHRKEGNTAASVQGGIMAYEFKRGSGLGWWHIHVHSVLMLSDDGPWDWKRGLLTAWREAVGHPKAVAHFTELHHWQGLDKTTAEDLAADLREVVKYPMKFSELGSRDVWEMFAKTKRQRLLKSFGCCYGLKPPESLDESDIAPDWDSVEFEELLFRYLEDAGEYVQAKSRCQDPGRCGSLVPTWYHEFDAWSCTQ